MDAIETITSRAMVAMATSHHLPSPCVSVCLMDEYTGLCTGCLRTLEEIRLWSVMEDDEKRKVWSEIAQRSKGEKL